MQNDLQKRILEAATKGEQVVNNMCKQELQKGIDHINAKVESRLQYLQNSEHVGPDYRGISN